MSVDPAALAQLLKGDEHAVMDRLFGDIREQYGYPREGPPLTMEEQKAGEVANCELVTQEVMLEHCGKRDLTSHSDFYRRATSTRDAPYFVASLVAANCFEAEAAVEAVAWAWSIPEWPDANFGSAMWLRLFGRVGYFHDADHGIDLTPPEEVPTLWRGAISSRRKGLAWTSDRERAEWFANRWAPGGPFKQAHLWTYPAGSVPARRVLARFDGRGENEWVIDTRRITPVIVMGTTEGGTT